jgi:prophage regulatory protein
MPMCHSSFHRNMETKNHHHKNQRRDARACVSCPSALRLLSFAVLRDRGIAYSWRLFHVGKFPAPVKLGPSRSAWVDAEIDAWIEARIAERSGVDGEVGDR